MTQNSDITKACLKVFNKLDEVVKMYKKAFDFPNPKIKLFEDPDVIKHNVKPPEPLYFEVTRVFKGKAHSQKNSDKFNKMIEKDNDAFCKWSKSFYWRQNNEKMVSDTWEKDINSSYPSTNAPFKYVITNNLFPDIKKEIITAGRWLFEDDDLDDKVLLAFSDMLLKM
eukprot:532688_1